MLLFGNAWETDSDSVVMLVLSRRLVFDNHDRMSLLRQALLLLLFLGFESTKITSVVTLAHTTTVAIFEVI